MDRVYQSNAIETPPSSVASSGSYPTAGNKASGQLATVPGPYWFYSITEEIRNAIASAGITPDLAQVNQLAQAMAKFLPLTGGTLTGPLTVDNTMMVKSASDSKRSLICGATDWSMGAHIVLSGRDNSSGGEFGLVARNDSTECSLTGTPNGALTWGGKDVERVSSSGTNYIRYENGLQIVWGLNVGGAVITFPVAFKSRPYITATHWGSSLCFPVPKGITNTGFTMTVYGTDYNQKTDSWADADWIAIGYWK